MCVWSCGGNADALIADVNLDVACVQQFKPDFAALGRILDGIAQQVANRVAQQLFVAVDRRRCSQD